MLCGNFASPILPGYSRVVISSINNYLTMLIVLALGNLGGFLWYLMHASYEVNWSPLLGITN